MARFVILRHDSPPQADRPTHWDLMLEGTDGLATWALAAPPAPGRAVAATRLADHRALYLDFEGPLSGDRGRVTRWDTGSYHLTAQSATVWQVMLSGRVLRGQLLLEADPHAPARWTARFSPV
jgi:hypothetical protein